MSDIATDAAQNTDREIWRERPGDYYSDSIHVTEDGAIGINCGGTVIVKPVGEWHRLAASEAERDTLARECEWRGLLLKVLCNCWQFDPIRNRLFLYGLVSKSFYISTATASPPVPTTPRLPR